MWKRSTYLAIAVVCAACPYVRGETFEARDTLTGEVGASHHAGYAPTVFAVRLSPPEDNTLPGAARIARFPSPRPDPTANDTVNIAILEWYAPERMGENVPAVLVLHTLDRRLFIARAVARALAQRGVHAFVLHAPGYGLRAYPTYRSYGDRFFERSAQTVADARRARDAIAALPGIDPHRISIQGTSLGGFWATSVAAMDSAFEYNFITLAGADLYGVLTHGAREAQWVRESLERNGIDDAKLRELCRPLDPANLAHRLAPERTWLFSAKEDQVVPAASAKALAAAVQLPEGHHVWLTGNHYSALLHLPWVGNRMADIILEAKGD